MSREICGNFDESDVTCVSCILNKVQTHNSCFKSVRKEQKTTMSAEINTDKINPSHYKSESGRECIDELRLMFGDEQVKAFCRCNAYKYRFRAGRKQNESAATDLAKAEWYLDYLETLEKGE